jgi:hypothetical protein
MKLAASLEESIQQYGDWRTERLQELRKLINETAPELQEGLKWGVPVWSYKGLVCAISGFKDHVKINFFKGAFLPNSSVFNNGLDSKEHRSVDFAEHDNIDKPALTALIKAAVEYNEE